jgi:hypothetical protein
MIGGSKEELEEDYAAWKAQPEDRERVRKILLQHLGLEPAREVPMEIEDIDIELEEAGCPRDFREEDIKVTLEELMGEVGRPQRKWMQI